VLSPSDPGLTFPAAEGDPGAEPNTYYVAGRLRGVRSGRSWAYLAVFTFNQFRGWLRSDFYTFALFDLDDGSYDTYTEHDLPRPPLPRRAYKLTVARGHLDVGFDSAAGACRWTTRRRPDGALEPFAYHLLLCGRAAGGKAMRLDVDVDPRKPPLPVGGVEYGGVKTCLGQYGTHSYFQSDVHARGRLVWGGMVAAPAHAFPIEYWSGPTRLEGTMQGKTVHGLGFHERTLPFTRDFELIEVLRASLRHLPPEAFPPNGPTPSAAADLAWEIDAFLSHHDRAAARRYLATRIRPVVDQLPDPHRAHLQQITDDVDASLA